MYQKILNVLADQFHHHIGLNVSKITKKEIEFKHNFRRLKRYELYFLEFYIGAKTCLYDIYFEQIINFCQMKDFSSKDK